MDNGITWFSPASLVEKYNLFYKKNKELIEANKDKTELELTLFKIPVQFFSNIYSYEKSKKSTYYRLQINKSSEKKKYRIYIDFNNNYNMNNNAIISSATNNIWNEKTLLMSEDIKSFNNTIGDIKISHEEDSSNYSSSLILNKIAIYFVREISIKTKAFVLRLRLEIPLGNGEKSNSRRLRDILLKPKAYNNFNIACRAEIEYDASKPFNPNEIERLLSILYGYDINKVYLSDNIQKFNLLTRVIPHKELFTMAINDLKNVAITPKVDGIECQFIIYNNNTFVYVNSRWINIESNFFWPKQKHFIRGIGEYYIVDESTKNRHTGNKDINTVSKLPRLVHKLYPFCVEISTKKNNNIHMSRLESLGYFFSHVNTSDTKLLNFDIKKILTNFESEQEFYIQVYNLLNMEFPYKIDGLIVFNTADSWQTNNNTHIIDYKLKLDNTVDLFGTIDIENNILMNGNSIVLNLYKYNLLKRKSVNVDGSYRRPICELSIFKSVKIKVKNENDDSDESNNSLSYFNFDVDINMIVVKHKENGNKFILIPHCFIAEYSVLYNEIIKFRIDKTNKYYDRMEYFGNSSEIVNRSISMHENNQIVSVKELLTAKSIKDLFKDNEPNDVHYYRPDTNDTTSGLLRRFNNFMKTDSIAMAANSMINKKVCSRVLDIDAGKGGDINKLYFMNVKYVFATDIDNNALNIYKERYDRVNANHRGKMFGYSLVKTCIINDDFIDTILKKMNIKRNEFNETHAFDLVNYQLAIHFYWEKKNFSTVLNNIKFFCKNKTKIVISTNNGYLIKKYLENTNELSLKIDSKENLYMHIIRAGDNKIRIICEPLTENEGVVENLVFNDELISEFEKHNFKLINVIDFNRYANDIVLFERMKEFNSHNTSASKLITTIINLFEQEKNNEDMKIALSLLTSYTFCYFK